MGVKKINGLEDFVNKFVRARGGDSTGLDAVTPAPTPPTEGLTATGGIISDYTSGSDVYRAHIFTSLGSFEVSEVGDFGDTVDYLVVAGGGGGGFGYPATGRGAGGGGAGGFRTATSFPVNPGSFPAPFSVTVGGGGHGNFLPSSPSTGGSGTPSTFGSITSYGGGGAGNAAGGNGLPGGSGGGGGDQSGPDYGLGGYGYNPSTPAPILSAVPLPSPYSIIQGHDGADASTSFPNPGGGGGGSAGPGSTPGPGGGGTANVYAYGPTGSVTYAAGGSGGGDPTASSGTTSTGDGGGGGPKSSSPVFGANGGSGIVVVRYQIGQLTTSAKATGGAISFYGGKTIHTFTTSGIFNVNNNSNSPLQCEYVVIGGGGGGGAYNNGGGGGAGGYRTATVHIPTGSNSVVIGAAGDRGISGASIPANRGSRGTYSQIDSNTTNFTIRSEGGGGGASNNAHGALPGASGGGGAASPTTAGTGNQDPSGNTVPAQGNSGGSGQSSAPYAGGGGGGAGYIGQNGPPDIGGYGGIGVQLPTTFRNPVSTPGTDGGGLGAIGPGSGDAALFWVAGGGGGGSHYEAQGKGGSHYPGGTHTGGPYAGGGDSGDGRPTASPGESTGENGMINTGGGGGSGAYSPNAGGGPAGIGGSGLVLIAYPS